MEQIISNITPLLNKLAIEFGVGIDFFKQHIVDYIMKYGQYHLINSIMMNFIITFVAVMILGGVTYFLITAFLVAEDLKFKSHKLFNQVFISVCVFIIIVITIIPIIQYKASPEIYSINAVYSNFIYNNK